jgi:hypothetical protein
MPWDLTIARVDQAPLGDVDAVRRAVEAAISGVRFYCEPSGLEKMAAAGIEFPEILRRHLEGSPATTQADFEGEGFSIRFFLGTGPEVERMGAEVRGGGDPLPTLRQLARATGWVVVEDSSGLHVAP